MADTEGNNEVMGDNTLGPLPSLSSAAPPVHTHVPSKRVWPNNRTRRARRRLYTQRELGARLGVSHYTVSRLEVMGFLSPLQRSYLKAIGYGVVFIPLRGAAPEDGTGPIGGSVG